MWYSCFLWNKFCTLYQIQVSVAFGRYRVTFVILGYAWEKRSTWCCPQFSCANHCRNISTFVILFVTGCYVWLINFHFINGFPTLHSLTFRMCHQFCTVTPSLTSVLPLWWNLWQRCSSFTFLQTWFSDCCHVKWPIFPDVFGFSNTIVESFWSQNVACRV
jgi:hypothetical protein